MKKSIKKFLFFSSLFGLIAVSSLHAEDYDRYAPVWQGDGSVPRSAETFQNAGKNFLVYPFELVKWPIDQSLIYIEEHHLYDKASWIYEQMKDFGVTPRLVKGASVRDKMGAGIELELVKLSRMKERYPDLTVETSAIWTLDHIQAYDLKIRQDKFAGTGLFMVK